MEGLNPSDLTKDELLSRYLQLQDRVEKFKQKYNEKDKKIELLQELIQQKNEEMVNTAIENGKVNLAGEDVQATIVIEGLEVTQDNASDSTSGE